MQTITDRDMKNKIGESLGSEGTIEWIERVYDKIHESYGLVDIDSIDPATYWEIVANTDPEV